MVNLDTEYQQRQQAWGGFLRLMGYSAVGIAIVLIGMWIFLI